MPLPEPEENESEDEFMDRCMSDEEIQDEFGKGTDQAVAVCLSKFNEAKNESIEQKLKKLRERVDRHGN